MSTGAVGSLDHELAVETGGGVAPQVFDPEVNLECLARRDPAGRRCHEGAGVCSLDLHLDAGDLDPVGVDLALQPHAER